MSSCLGIYIEDNIIKYAKVSEERDIVKLETYGIKFYEQLEETIEQIVNETLSYKIPISINTANEQYNYFEMFSMLSEKDMQKAIATEFELLCEEKGYNKNVLDSRNVLINNIENKDRITAMHIFLNKAEVAKKIQQFQKYNLKAITPLPLAITNNIEIGVKENAIIVNLENQSTVTTIINGQVNRVDVLEHGMNKILEEINKNENSYAKVYDILKNTTIYTLEGKELQEENSQYLEEIMPTLYNIVSEVKKIVSENFYHIDKMYISGTGALINNIDLYFQESILDTKCEILKPYFTKNISMTQINIKDYVEVNSAIALALQGIGQGIKKINFKSEKPTDIIKEILHKDISIKNLKNTKTSAGKTKFKWNFDLNLKGKFDNIEKSLLRTCSALLFVAIFYSIVSIVTTNMITDKEEEADLVIADSNKQIQEIESDTQILNNKVNEYNQLINNLDNINAQIQEKNSFRNSIPNLLINIMSSIPKNVQILKIQNTESKHITITARSLDYTSLGLFIATLDAGETLLNVKSNSSVKQDNMITITI